METRIRAVLMLVMLLGGTALGARQQATKLLDSQRHENDRKGLLTYHFRTKRPMLHVMGPGRPGTTRVQLQFGQEQLDGSSMPVVATTLEGVRHSVADTWKFFEVSATGAGSISLRPAWQGQASC